MRMDAYYFSFTPTGIEMIDRVLSAVACAGKAYHHTESWNEPVAPYEEFLRGTTCAEWIQCAAADAASAFKAQDEKLARLGMDAQAACDRPAMDTLKRLQVTLNVLTLADAGARKGDQQ